MDKIAKDYKMELSEIKGFGPKRIACLKENGITDVSDLLTVFPYKYVNLKNTVLPSEGVGKGTVTVSAIVEQPPVVRYIRKGLFLTLSQMSCQDGESVECSWFNQKYLKNKLTVGKKFFLSGEVQRFGTKLCMKNPILIDYATDMPDIYPLYRPLKGIPSVALIAAIDTALKTVRVNSYLDKAITDKFGLLELNDSFSVIHRPKNFNDLEAARQSMALENLSCNIALYSLLKKTGEKKHSYSDNLKKITEIAESLPYKLTSDQQSALNQILTDMNSPKKMNRLLQGDVGSGKTVVALLTMLYAALSGLQSVLMSPTELLSRQHFETALRLFQGLNLKTVFLSSSLSSAEREATLRFISNGEAKIIIGTHSLIQDDVFFRNLALIITDEQQRFGVKQRGALENKADNADYLVMTATPIPRTLALTLYGDLNQSLIKTLPLKKAKIFTKFVPNRKIDGMLNYIKEKAEAGEKTYMVCPRIDDEELISVNRLYKELKNTALKNYVGCLHGRMDDEEKKAVMNRFSNGNLKVLVTTSIIEVGIDVPAATTIAIYNAERYGLSQLHQLRGRVGRGEKDSYCFILTDDINQKAKERLDYFINCSDGFELAEYDFKQRGAGDFLGTRQHGDSFLSDLNKPIIETAKDIAKTLVKSSKFKERIKQGVKESNMIFIENLTMN